MWSEEWRSVVCSWCISLQIRLGVMTIVRQFSFAVLSACLSGLTRRSDCSIDHQRRYSVRQLWWYAVSQSLIGFWWTDAESSRAVSPRSARPWLLYWLYVCVMSLSLCHPGQHAIFLSCLLHVTAAISSLCYQIKSLKSNHIKFISSKPKYKNSVSLPGFTRFA